MRSFALIIGLFFSIFLVAQDKKPAKVNPVATIDGIVNETLKIISGEKGKKVDWDAYRNLYTAKAQLSALVHDSLGNGTIKTFTLEEFVRLGRAFYEHNDFVESEITKQIDEYNGIAHVFQSYKAQRATGEERGINSFQLIYDGKRWWITSVLWTNDVNGVKLPEKYFK